MITPTRYISLIISINSAKGDPENYVNLRVVNIKF